MLSILIPTYNYSVSSLVNSLNEQANLLNIDYEIIILEDGSTYFRNKTINSPNTKIIILNKNKGRVYARQRLAEEAKYDWLLFLDSDVLPKNKNFIQSYIEKIKKNHDAIFGGYAYEKEIPDHDYLLRWKYGRRNEEVAAKKRNEKPYKIIIFGNFIIKKSVFIKLNSTINCTMYGEDNHFGVLLKTNKHDVFHIDNQVYHLGIDSSINYLEKQKEATNSLLHLYATSKNFKSDNDLLNFFMLLKKFNLAFIFSLMYKNFKNLMTKNLISKKPSINILQLYRISFMCYSHLKTN